MPNIPMSEKELEKALLGFKGGYGGNSLSTLMQLITQYTLSKQLEIRSEEVKNLYELRKLYDRYELEDARDPSGVKMASWQGYKSFRNPISDRIEAITGVRHDQGIEEWLNSNKSKEE